MVEILVVKKLGWSCSSEETSSEETIYTSGGTLVETVVVKNRRIGREEVVIGGYTSKLVIAHNFRYTV